MKFRLKSNKAWLILPILFWAQGSFAQKKVSFGYLDSLCYQQYLNEDWNGLVKSTRIAYKNDLDYYYMRMRTGIAYYEKHRYLQAEKHFKKAEKFNDIDKINKEYIYYSKLFSGKQSDAQLYYYNNESYLKNSVNLEKKDVALFSFDVVYFNNPVSDPSALFEDFNNTGPIDGEQLLTLNYQLSNFKLVHQLGKNLRFIHGGSILNKNSHYYLKNDGLFVNKTIRGIKQIQYYGGLSINPASGLNITGALHYLHFSFPDFSGDWGGFSTRVAGYSGNFMSSRLSAYKYLGRFNFGGGISYSTLNFKKQLQKDVRLAFYPLGNLNLYTLSTLFLLSEDDNYDVKSFKSFKQEIGFKTFGNIWFEAKIQAGDIKNYTEHDGFSIYNGNDTQTARYDFSFILVGAKTNIRLMASYLEYYVDYFDLSEMRTVDLNKIDSKGLTIIGEISWKF